MLTLCITVFGASLLGSLHCAGMCGGFVALFAGTATPSERLRAHFAWHGTRLLTYATLGAIAGGLGGALDLAGSLAGWPQIAAALAGIGMALWGAFTLLQLAGVGFATRLVAGLRKSFTGRKVAPFQRAIRHLHSRPPVVRAVVLGLSSALLPCGWLYAFVIAAAGTANLWAGAALMAAFWLGNLPLLAGLGALVQRLSGPMRKHLPVATATALLVVGVLTVVQRLQVVPSPHCPAALGSAASLQDVWRLGWAGATCHGSR